MDAWQEPEDSDEQDDSSDDAESFAKEFDEFLEERELGLTVDEHVYLQNVILHVTKDFPVMEGLMDIEHETINDKVMRLYMEKESHPEKSTAHQEYMRAAAEEKLVLMMQYPLCMRPDALDDLGLALIESGMADVDEDRVNVYYGVLEDFFDLCCVTQKYASLVKSLERALRDGDIADADNLKELLSEDILGYTRSQLGIPLEKDELVRRHLCVAKDNALETVLTCAMDASPEQRDVYLERATRILEYDVTFGFKEEDDVDPVDYSWAKEFAESLKNTK